MDDIWDALIIGGGPAGLSAALMLGRARRRVCVVDAGAPRNRFAAHMHGVLGHEGTPPGELLARGRAEAAAYGVSFLDADVERVDVGTTSPTPGADVTLGDGRVLHARAVVVATGLRDDLPAVPGLAPLWGTAVLHCPYCHGWEVRDQRLGVLTTSPVSLHQAMLVRQWSDRITVFTSGLGDLAPDARQRLRSRGIALVDSPVVEVGARAGAGAVAEAGADGTTGAIADAGADRTTAAPLTIRTADGGSFPLDALFTGGTLHPLDHFLAHLDLERTDTPMGRFLAADATGLTSSPRIWAAGNVVTPHATVPMSMGAGALAGAAVNAFLVSEDFDRAVATSSGASTADRSASDFWEERYAGSSAVWSGRVNATLAAVVAEYLASPGRALDIGCGEGGDALWLAEQGWDVTGVDISATALARARAAAADRGFGPDRVRFLLDDLDDAAGRWGPADAGDLDAAGSTSGGSSFDLVTASFLHSPVVLSRTEILRRAASRVAPDGHLLIVSHLAPPPWSALAHDHGAPLLAPADELAALDLDPVLWEVVLAEARPRAVVAPSGEPAEIEDAVILLRRR